MVNKAFARIGRQNHCGDAQARPPAVALWGRDMVPCAAILVGCDDDGRVGPVRAGLKRRDDFGNMFVARRQIGIAWVQIVPANRLVEGDGWQPASGNISAKINKVFQVFVTRGQARREIGKIIERLVMRLEVFRRLVGYDFAAGGVIPSTRIPGPGNRLFAEPVADRRKRLWRQALCGLGLARIGRKIWLHGVDGKSVWGHRAVVVPDWRAIERAGGGFFVTGQQACCRVNLRDHCGERGGKHRRAGAHQPEMIEE